MDSVVVLYVLMISDVYRLMVLPESSHVKAVVLENNLFLSSVRDVKDI
jgi:hypothetical protein